MTRDEMKAVLSSIRPGPISEEDPRVREALRAMEKDPDLAAWFEQEQKTELAITAKLRSVPVPADLKARILSHSAKIVRGPSWWERRETWVLAAAAAVIALLALPAQLEKGKAPVSVSVAAHEPAFNSIRTQAVAFVNTDFALDKESPDLPKLESWLKEEQAANDILLPGNVRSIASIGCRTLKIEGRRMALICFDIGNGQLMHLLVTEKNGITGQPPLGHPEFIEVGKWNTASWSDDKNAYVLMAPMKTDAMLKLFGG
jgi:hypothetical protein